MQPTNHKPQLKHHDDCTMATTAAVASRSCAQVPAAIKGIRRRQANTDACANPPFDWLVSRPKAKRPMSRELRKLGLKPVRTRTVICAELNAAPSRLEPSLQMMCTSLGPKKRQTAMQANASKLGWKVYSFHSKFCTNAVGRVMSCMLHTVMLGLVVDLGNNRVSCVIQVTCNPAILVRV